MKPIALLASGSYSGLQISPLNLVPQTDMEDAISHLMSLEILFRILLVY